MLGLLKLKLQAVARREEEEVAGRAAAANASFIDAKMGLDRATEAKAKADAAFAAHPFLFDPPKSDQSPRPPRNSTPSLRAGALPTASPTCKRGRIQSEPLQRPSLRPHRRRSVLSIIRRRRLPPHCRSRRVSRGQGLRLTSSSRGL